ncbi:lactate utilization protein C [Streptomyces sp. NPDC090022]|uniref:LutC/YkgG family protein n=1 Tax=Streptomyces sp. NPDC090022 TaxID=3365920 RepID=UPI00380C0E2B
MSSRERILARIRRAVPDPGPDLDIPRDYLMVHAARTPQERVELLAANLTEYRAHVHRATRGTCREVVAGLLAGARTVQLPPALGFDLKPGPHDGPPPEHSPPPDPSPTTDHSPAPDHTRFPVLVHDRADQTLAELDRVDTVVTGCALAVAETGTLVLDGGPDQGRRRITLVPDHHICLVRVPDQVVDSVPQALALLDPARPLTWISGPSATSDIELDRVEGVHGPRRLDVVLVTP